MRAARQPEAGAALLMVLLSLMIIAGLSMSVALVTSTEMEVSGNYHGITRVFYAADGSAQASFNELVVLSQSLGRFPTDPELAAIVPPAVEGSVVVDHQVVSDGAMVVEPLQTGFYQGLVAMTQPFSSRVTVETTGYPSGRATVEMGVLMDIIPIFQFAVLYEDDLEIHPGPTMTLNGRVHTNADLYVGANNELTVDAAVTSAGDIFNRRKDSAAAPSGTVRFRDSVGGFPAMNGLDSDDANWYEEALERWDGNVRSAVHGIERLNLTIADPGDPHAIIEPGLDGDTSDDEATKLFYAADVRVLNGQAYDPDGNRVPLYDAVIDGSPIRFTVIDDPREDHPMLTMEIDVEALGRTAGFPANGILYAGGFEPGAGLPAWLASEWVGGTEGFDAWPDAWAGYQPPYDGGDTGLAVKLSNGDDLPGPLTVVSDNPVYVRGDYNVVAKVPAAVIADAINVLSNNWGRKDENDDPVPADEPDDDLGYSRLPLNDRDATDTTINAAFMLGNEETTWGDYNGGLENLPRFLERWSGESFTYLGSLVDLWISQRAVGDWSYGDPIYTAPIRDWAFDTDFLDPANLPPGTPQVYTLRVSNWRRE